MPKKSKEEKVAKNKEIIGISDDKIEQPIGLGAEEAIFDEESDEEELEDLED